MFLSTPIQHWFLEQDLSDPSHYNQAFLLEVSEQMERSLLVSAFKHVLREHDALRLRLVRDGERWCQFFSADDENVRIDFVNLSGISEEGQRLSIEATAATAQQNLSLEHGPLFSVRYFDLGPAKRARLLVVIHHMAVDGISWRPLLEDLETAYLQLKHGHPVTLSAKTTSFKKWAEQLQTFAKTNSLQSELPYWRNITSFEQ